MVLEPAVAGQRDERAHLWPGVDWEFLHRLLKELLGAMITLGGEECRMRWWYLGFT